MGFIIHKDEKVNQSKIKGSGSIILECVVCGDKFKASPSRVRPTGNTCSVECMGIRNRKPNNVKCCICNKPFHVKAFRLKKMVNPERICCSMICDSERRRIDVRGEENHQFNVKGELNTSWKSDIRLSGFGYILIRNINHPYTTKSNMMPLHRLLYEEYAKEVKDFSVLEFSKSINDYVLRADIVIHHKDEVKTNNVIENLEPMSITEHIHLHNKNILKDRNLVTGRYISSKNTSMVSKKYKFDAGQDIKSSIDCSIKAHSNLIIPTGIHVTIPEGYVGLLWSKSGLSVNHNIEVGAGCIDCGYTGEIKVHLYNFSDKDFVIQSGDKIAQMITIPININEYVKVSGNLVGERGDNGFGSTGK